MISGKGMKAVRRFMVGGFIMVLFFASACKPAQAQWTCDNCSTWWEQISQEIDENGTMIQTAQTAATQLQMLYNQIKMMEVTPSQAFSQVNNIMNTLNKVAQGGNALSYAMSNLDQQFTANYAPLGSTSSGTTAASTSYATQYTQWSKTSLDTTQKALDVASQQNTNQQSETTLISNLQQQAQSADANVSTVQVGNQIAAEELNQLMQLRQLMMADMSAKAAFQAQQIKEHDQAVSLCSFFQPSGPSVASLTGSTTTTTSSSTTGDNCSSSTSGTGGTN